MAESLAQRIVPRKFLVVWRLLARDSDGHATTHPMLLGLASRTLTLLLVPARTDSC